MKRISLGAVVVSIIVAAVSQKAYAADMPDKNVPDSEAPSARVYGWTGWRAGVNGGGAFDPGQTVGVNETSSGAPFISGSWPGFGTFGSLKPSGSFGGGQIGYNWQTGSWVLGIEGDIQGASVQDTQSVTISPYISAPNGITVATSDKLSWFGTVRGRVGWAADRWLLYATAGFGVGGIRYASNMVDTFGFSAVNSVNTTRGGYVVGGGVEYAFQQNWSVKLAYQFLDLGSATFNSVEFSAGAPTLLVLSNNVKFDYQTVRVGLNFKFN